MKNKVIVIGVGASGIMSAIAAASCGADVVLLEKNEKQNWLLINNSIYFESLKSLLAEPYKVFCSNLTEASSWSAFQIRFDGKEIMMAGYMPDQLPFHKRYTHQENSSRTSAAVIPFSSDYYAVLQISNPEKYVEFFASLNNPDLESDISNFKFLKPISNYFFTLQNDSITYRYLAVRIDSAYANMENFIYSDSLHSAGGINFRQYSIYKSNLGEYNQLLPPLFANVKTNYFTKHQGYYVFSDTTTSLQYYIQKISNGAINNKPLYRFVKSNLPSTNIYEFCLLAYDYNQLARYASPEGLRTNLFKGLQIFTYSFSAPENGYVPINVYFKFE
jgi:hypothetical protein